MEYISVSERSKKYHITLNVHLLAFSYCQIITLQELGYCIV
jgi:hypothetical protein